MSSSTARSASKATSSRPRSARTGRPRTRSASLAAERSRWIRSSSTEPMPLEETYLGKERVTGTAKIEGTNDLQIAFADGTQRVMPERRFEAEKTATPIDLTALRERRVQGIVKDLLTILLGWDMPLVDFEHVVSTLGLSLDNL